MSEELSLMKSETNGSDVPKKRHHRHHDEKRHRKKKKSSAEDEGSKVIKTNPQTNGFKVTERFVEELPAPSSPVRIKTTNGIQTQPSPEPKKAKKLLPIQSSDSSGAPSVSPLQVHGSSPTSPADSSVSSPAKKVIQFQESDESDDGDYTPKRKRKDLNLLSPRHTKLSKPGLISPKKVDTRERLLNKRRELQSEREKLPIWTGTTVISLI
jgi:hypothetical protein